MTSKHVIKMSGNRKNLYTYFSTGSWRPGLSCSDGGFPCGQSQFVITIWGLLHVVRTQYLHRYIDDIQTITELYPQLSLLYLNLQSNKNQANTRLL